MESVASRYGLALYSLALEENKIDSWQKDVKTLKSIFEENTDFIMILGSSFISLEERLEIVEKTLVGVDKNIIGLIDVIMENNRTDLILDVFESFNSYCNQYRGVSEGLIYSTLRLDQTVINQIEKKISKIDFY